MRNKLAGMVITGALLGFIGAKMAKYISKEEAQKETDVEELPEGFVWIDGMNLDEENAYPFFDRGDYVILRNPYNNGMWTGNSDMDSPIVFEVIGEKYDQDDEEWRYKITPRDVSEAECGLEFDLKTEWIAENWMDFASKASFHRREFTEAGEVGASVLIAKKELPEQGTEIVTPELGVSAMVALEIDYWLDTLLHSSDVEERRQAEERLTELTNKKSEEESE